MNVASRENSKELYAISKWVDPDALPIYEGDEVVGYEYTLGFLVRKLPQNSWVGYTDTSGSRGYALAYTYAWNYQGNDIAKVAECMADELEDAAAKLCIKLFKQGILATTKREEK